MLQSADKSRQPGTSGAKIQADCPGGIAVDGLVDPQGAEAAGGADALSACSGGLLWPGPC